MVPIESVAKKKKLLKAITELTEKMTHESPLVRRIFLGLIIFVLYYIDLNFNSLK